MRTRPPPVDQMNATVDRVLQTLLDNRELPRILLREAVGIDVDFDRKLSEFYGRIEAMLIGRAQHRAPAGRGASVRRQGRRALRSREHQGGRAVGVRRAGHPAHEMTQIGREMIAFTLKGCLVDGS